MTWVSRDPNPNRYPFPDLNRNLHNLHLSHSNTVACHIYNCLDTLPSDSIRSRRDAGAPTPAATPASPLAAGNTYLAGMRSSETFAAGCRLNMAAMCHRHGAWDNWRPHGRTVASSQVVDRRLIGQQAIDPTVWPDGSDLISAMSVISICAPHSTDSQYLRSSFAALAVPDSHKHRYTLSPTAVRQCCTVYGVSVTLTLVRTIAAPPLLSDRTDSWLTSMDRIDHRHCHSPSPIPSPIPIRIPIQIPIRSVVLRIRLGRSIVQLCLAVVGFRFRHP